MGPAAGDSRPFLFIPVSRFDKFTGRRFLLADVSEHQMGGRLELGLGGRMDDGME